MNFTRLCLLFVLNSAFLVSALTPEEIETEIVRLTTYLRDGVEVGSILRQDLLKEALEFGTEDQLQTILDLLFDMSTFPLNPSALDLVDDTVSVTIPLDFSEFDRLLLAKQALNTLAERGFHIQVQLQSLKGADVRNDAKFFRFLVRSGFLDVNEAMAMSALAGNYKLALFFVQEGADINCLPQNSSITSHILVLAAKDADLETFKDLETAGAHIPEEHQYLMLSSAIIDRRFEIARHLMNKSVPFPNIWSFLLYAKAWDLFEDALKNGYALDLPHRKQIIKDCFGNQKFKFAMVFMNAPLEDQKELFNYALDLIQNVDRSKLKSHHIRKEFSAFDEFVTQRAFNILAHE